MVLILCEYVQNYPLSLQCDGLRSIRVSVMKSRFERDENVGEKAIGLSARTQIQNQIQFEKVNMFISFVVLHGDYIPV